jgi:geranylgeranyl pyrophosphate synthase
VAGPRARLLEAHAERRQDRGRRLRARGRADEEAHAIDATLERARHYGAIARDALAIFPADANAGALTEVIGFCVSRAN